MNPTLVVEMKLDQKLADSLSRVVVIEKKPDRFHLCFTLQSESGDLVSESIQLTKEQCFWLRDRIQRVIDNPIVPTNKPVEFASYEVV